MNANSNNIGSEAVRISNIEKTVRSRMTIFIFVYYIYFS